MVFFNADGSQPDHAQRAARAAAAIVAAGNAVVASHPGWPVFRVGINTGPAVVGTVGAAARRSVATIGDTINTAARLMAAGVYSATGSPASAAASMATPRACPSFNALRAFVA